MLNKLLLGHDTEDPVPHFLPGLHDMERKLHLPPAKKKGSFPPLTLRSTTPVQESEAVHRPWAPTSGGSTFLNQPFSKASSSLVTGNTLWRDRSRQVQRENNSLFYVLFCQHLYLILPVQMVVTFRMDKEN